MIKISRLIIFYYHRVVSCGYTDILSGQKSTKITYFYFPFANKTGHDLICGEKAALKDHEIVAICSHLFI